jgi:hypothetical protein
MTAVEESRGVARFQSIGTGTEIWGATQANYIVKLPGSNAKEVAILLNSPAAANLAAAVGKEDSEEFREAAVRAAGEAILSDVIDSGRPLESVVVASNAYFEARPELLEKIRAALA